MSTVIEQAAPATITKTERTWRATIETPRDAPYSLHVHREVAITGADDALVGSVVKDRDYSWPFDEIAAKQITLSGVTMTVEQIAGFCQAAFDQLVAERKAAEAAPPPE